MWTAPGSAATWWRSTRGPPCWRWITTWRTVGCGLSFTSCPASAGGWNASASRAGTTLRPRAVRNYRRRGGPREACCGNRRSRFLLELLQALRRARLFLLVVAQLAVIAELLHIEILIRHER